MQGLAGENQGTCQVRKAAQEESMARFFERQRSWVVRARRSAICALADEKHIDRSGGSIRRRSWLDGEMHCKVYHHHTNRGAYVGLYPVLS